MDALLEDLQIVCSELLPILGAAALIYLCILLKKAGKVMDSVNTTVINLDPTMKKVDTSLDKIQAPLDTAVRLSHSVDKVQDKTEEALGKVTSFAVDSVNNLRDCAAKHEEKKAEKTENGGTEDVGE